jgi:hypothetical protein
MKQGGKMMTATLLLGTCMLVLTPAAFAKRVHDPAVAAKVDVQPSNVQGHTNNLTMTGAVSAARPGLRERIQAILHPPAECLKNPLPSVGMEANSILGHPIATQQQCVEYLLSINPHPAISVPPQTLVAYYYAEGEREGVRPDMAFAQALKETGYFRYGGTVTPDQNNYCGLGTTSTSVKGAYFSDSLLGVRAHIQHLLAYASTRPPMVPVVDPRYDLVRSVYGDDTLGSWEDLNGRWAVPGYTYGQSIMDLFDHILQEP